MLYQFPINPDDFTVAKVYRCLVEKFDAVRAPDASLVHLDRYSLDSDEGIASQVGRSTRLHSADPDVQAYLSIPDAEFDAARAGGPTAHGVVSVALQDVHPSITTNEVLGSLVRCGRTVFGRLETSSTKTQIWRPDGDDENGYTVFLMGLMNYLVGSLREIRWSDDPRRAGRDNANWSRILRRASELGLMLTFGTKTYDPQSEHLLMLLMGGMSEQDDVTRRKSVTGGRVEKLLEHGCPIAEAQLPAGVRHRRLPDGRVHHDKQLNLLAEPDVALHPVIVDALRRHAAGSSYADIGREVLVPHAVPRRGQSLPPGATYADLAQDPAALSDATKNFFVVASRTGPGEEHLYLGKLTLWQTGSYPYRVANDLRQRGVPVGGLVPTYDGPDDVTGHFDFLLQWDCALQGFGSDDERDEVIDACRKRILEERTAARTAKGRAAATGDRRAIQQFGRWTADTADDERWPGDTTEYGITTRRHNSGKDTFVVVHFPTSAAIAADGRPKGLWSFTAKPQQHVAGTFASDALCASVSVQVQRRSRPSAALTGPVASGGTRTTWSCCRRSLPAGSASSAPSAAGRRTRRRRGPRCSSRCSTCPTSPALAPGEVCAPPTRPSSRLARCPLRWRDAAQPHEQELCPCVRGTSDQSCGGEPGAPVDRRAAGARGHRSGPGGPTDDASTSEIPRQRRRRAVRVAVD